MAARAAAVSPARVAAFDVLLRVFEDEAYADRAFRSAAAGLDERDRALAQRLAFGAVQRVRTLDHAIETLGRRPVRRLDLERPARELVDHVRALTPHIGARAELHGRGVTIWRARVADNGSFEPIEVQPDGGRRMAYEAWLRGLRR